MKWIKLKLSLLVAAVFAACLGIVITSSQQAFADTSISVLVQKSKFYALTKCYDGGSTFRSPIYSSQTWEGMNSFIYKVTQNSATTTVYNSNNEYEIASCYTLANSFESKVPPDGASLNELNQFFDDIGYTRKTTADKVIPCATLNFVSAQAGNGFVTICADTSDGTAKGTLNGSFTNSSVAAFDISYRQASSAKQPIKLSPKARSSEVEIDCAVSVGSTVSGIVGGIIGSGIGGISGGDQLSSEWGNGGCSPVKYTTGSTTLEFLAEEIKGQVQGAINEYGSISTDKWVLSSPALDYSKTTSDEYQEYTQSTSVNKLLSRFSGGVYKSKTALKLTDEEKIAMLEYSLDHFFSKMYYLNSASKACSLSESEASTAKAQGYTVLSTGGADCYIKATRNADKKAPSYNTDSGYLDGAEINFATLVLQLNTLRDSTYGTEYQKVKDECNAKYSTQASNLRSQALGIIAQARHDPDLVDATTLDNANKVVSEINKMGGQYWETTDTGGIQCVVLPTLDGGTTERDPDDPSYNAPSVDLDGEPQGDNGINCSSEINGLGWILCPTLTILGNTVGGIYDNYIKTNFLEVKPEWLDTNSQIYTEGWSKFRNYANILFAILLIIVILSQVTGIGITNYGLKKMLPRLIMIAVLINLSFFICQLAVDISNLLGVSLEQVLSGVGVASEMPTGNATGGGGAGSIATVLSVAGIAAAGASIGAWAVPVLLGLVGSLISVLFCAIILGLRQALVILLVVISPLAIACYVLDGTKSLFDKWRKLFVALLAVFPICGLLMGGGVFGSSLIWSVATGNFFLQLVSALLKVAPFFLIPSVLKQSFAVAGNIGAKISRIGSGIQGDFTRIARKSDLYQRVDTAAGAAHTKTSNFMRRSIRKIPGVSSIADSAFGKFLGKGGNRRRAQFIQKQSRLAYTDADASAIARSGLLTADRRKGIQAAADERAENQAVDEEMAANRAEEGFDVGNSKQLSERLNTLAQQYDQTHDITLRRKIKAISKFMIDFDEGRNQFDKSFHEIAQKSPNSATAQALNKFIQLPDITSKLKQTGHRGTVKLSQDLSAGNQVGSFNGYLSSQTHKFAPEMVGQIDTSVLEQQLAAIKAGDLKGPELKRLVTTYDTALKSETSRNKISTENQNLIKQIFTAAGQSNSIYIPR